MIREFDGGRQTAIEWEELEPIVRRYFAAARTAQDGTAEAQTVRR